MLPRISLVVPARNEEKLLPRLLDSLEAARTAAPGIPVEIVIADNASSDRTAAIATARGCRVTRVERRSIAAARNAGAAIARGEILAFTDADGRVHPRTFAIVERALADPAVIGGATGVVMERWSVGIGLTYLMALPLLWLTGFDTGVVFVRREDFVAIGGYDESRGYGEDVALLLALRRRGRATGRHLARPRGAKTIASTRKFDRFGDWHFFTRMPALAWRMFFRGSAATEFSRTYWYDDDR